MGDWRALSLPLFCLSEFMNGSFSIDFSWGEVLFFSC